jgi:hypothetical protein
VEVDELDAFDAFDDSADSPRPVLVLVLAVICRMEDVVFLLTEKLDWTREWPNTVGWQRGKLVQQVRCDWLAREGDHLPFKERTMDGKMLLAVWPGT